MEIEELIRPSILKLIPYSSARHEFEGKASVFLDANENPYGSPLANNYNRYPDPLQQKLKNKIAAIKGIPAQHIFLGNGSDEAIDLLYRIFCNPGIDNVIICPPTYGMYAVSAGINDIEVKEVQLTTDYNLDVPSIMKAVNDHTKMIFICSPNNPTGNAMRFDDVEFLLNNFRGIVVIDEAYINYSKQRSLMRELTEYENLVILQTFSKAWGMAGLRLGMAFSTSVIINYMNRVKPPYNINAVTIELVEDAIGNISSVNEQIKKSVQERSRLADELKKNSHVITVYPSDANFLLVKVKNPDELYQYLIQDGVVVRNRSNVTGCEGCLRITIGTETENNKLIDLIKRFSI